MVVNRACGMELGESGRGGWVLVCVWWERQWMGGRSRASSSVLPYPIFYLFSLGRTDQRREDDAHDQRPREGVSKTNRQRLRD